ncbi:hypothetical protein LSCM1_05529 [Leishmania martiniquensis]|uniref:Uncharacterized protein n=1 Tax=Leishmania martiniquensis TaxID=1580590 RepID=A0A836HP06_9TRYP|nr:hypothetical protein LSCM1_05529 [Leishmania martiniquensis]
MQTHETPMLGNEATSPPPRPPKGNGSGKCDYHDQERGPAGDAQSITASKGRPASLEETPVMCSEDAITPKCAAPRCRPSGEALASLVCPEADRDCAGEAAEARAATSLDYTAMLATTQLLSATSMTLSPSVHRPAATKRVAAMAVASSPREPDGPAEDDDGRDCDPRKSLKAAKAAEEAVSDTPSAGLDGSMRCGVRSNGAIHSGAAAAAEAEEESDDEDEDGLFLETVLFMNNNFHSLGSTRRTPVKAPQQPSQEKVAGSASPTPHMPRSLEVTPVKQPSTGREVPAEVRSAGHPDRVEPDTVSSGSKKGSAADMMASRCFTAPVSPATTVNTHAPGVAGSPLPTPQQCYRSDPCACAFATAPTTAATSAVASEYLFIDNHDGTAYLADASLQLDGSYALGQTILLARSTATSEASPTSAARRNAAGSESPVVKSQPASDLPQQRDSAAHRPPRDALATVVLPAPVAEPISPGSPAPHPIQNGAASPLSPSIARVVRRSAALSRDASSLPVASAAGAWLLRSSFGDSFSFDQTLLVPLDENTKGSHSAVIADASMMADRSYRSAAPARSEAYASPTAVTPALSLPAISFRAFQTGAGGRERGVPRLSPPCPATSFSASRASPVPVAPIATEKLASQQARATRERRTVRSDQDVIYLIPATTATATLTPEEIIREGWIPVQVVDALPSAAAAAGPVAGADGRSRSHIGGGGAESPVPEIPYATGAASRATSHDGGLGEFEREKSLSRRSNSGHGDAAGPIFSPASTLSASTLECINRRLSFSMSGWASVRQHLGAASQPDADGASVANVAGSLVLPPATPLLLAGHSHDCHRRRNTNDGSTQRESTAGRPGGEGTFDGNFSAFSAEPTNDSQSPVPEPPELSETPQREQSPPRCTAATTPIGSHQGDRPGGAPAAEEDDTDVAANADCRSLLTSMSYQRPSTAGLPTSELNTNDSSLSIPLTSSASASLGMGALRPSAGGRYAGGVAAGAVEAHHPSQQVPHQLRAPHPRRMSATGLSDGAAPSSVAAQAFGERRQRVPAGTALPFSNVAGAASNNSFRRTYCNNRSSAVSGEAILLNPSVGASDAPGSSSVSTAGLPLSRGALPYRYPQHGTGMIRIHSAGNLQVERATMDAGAMSFSSTAARSGAVSRSSVLCHPRNSSPQEQQYLRWLEAVDRVGAGPAVTGGCRAAATAVRPVPDTSVFLPWAPLTITPEGSVNVGGSRETGLQSGAAAATGAPASYVPMTLVPFTSSAETSTMASTTTATTAVTATTACDTVSAREVAQQISDDLTSGEAVLSAATLRTLNTAVAAAMLKAAPSEQAAAAATVMAANDGGCSGGGVSRGAFVSSFLQHAAAQLRTSVDSGVRNASPDAVPSCAKSMAVSRASMTTLRDCFTVCDGSGALTAAMEATVNQFQASLYGASTAAATEPEAQAPDVSSTTMVPSSAYVCEQDRDASKENCSGCLRMGLDPAGGSSAAEGAQHPTPLGLARPVGLREGFPANTAGQLSSKERSLSRPASPDGASLRTQRLPQ